MKAIIFDSSSLISISMNGLFPELRKLKENFNGHFVIPKEVEREIIDKPIKIKRFELEAVKISELVKDKILVRPKDIGITDKEITSSMFKLMDMANTMFVGNGQKINIIHTGEGAVLALSKILNKKGVENVICMDERTTRMLVEKPENLQSLLERRMHKRIRLKKSNFGPFRGFKIIRSTELMYVAYKKGLTRWKHKNLLDALMFGLKFKGCAISHDEIEVIKRLG